MVMQLNYGAQALLEEYDPNKVANGFTERLRVAAASGKHDEPRTIAAPYYLTDLGVRKFSDPTEFYFGHVESVKWRTRISRHKTGAMMMAAPLSSLAGMLDACVLLLGDYELAQSVVRERMAEITATAPPLLLVYSGVLFAVDGKTLCRDLLARVEHIPNARPSTRFMALHRLAAAEIKRFNNPHAGLEIMSRLERLISDLHAWGDINNNDAEALRSILGNLRALAYIRLGDSARGEREVRVARNRMPQDGFSVLGVTESARYASQESINIGQLLTLDGNFDDAVIELTSNVSFCASHAADYLGEAWAALAYCQFLARDYATACDSAKSAISFIALEASPSRLRVVREVLAGSLSELGRIDEATGIMDDIGTDPLGLAMLPESRKGHR